MDMRTLALAVLNVHNLPDRSGISDYLSSNSGAKHKRQPGRCVTTDIERPAGLLYNTGMGQIVIALDSRYSNSPLARQLVEAGFSVQIRSNH